jgi:hypothetical protein
MSELSSGKARWVPALDPLVCGVSAWAITVAWPVSERFAPASARVLAAVAVSALGAGALLSPFWPRVGRTLSIWIFVASCAAVWALVPLSTLPGRLDPAEGAAGSLAWAFFAVSWGSPPSRWSTASSTSTTSAPRGRLALGTILLAWSGILLALVPPMLAFWVPDRDRALFAQAAALVVAAALASHAVTVAAAATEAPAAHRAFAARRPFSARALVPAAWSLLFLVLLLLLRAGYHLLR